MSKVSPIIDHAPVQWGQTAMDFVETVPEKRVSGGVWEDVRISREQNIEIFGSAWEHGGSYVIQTEIRFRRGFYVYTRRTACAK